MTRISKIKAEIGYKLHKPARRTYPHRHIKILGFKDLFQADLFILDQYKKENKGYKYVLLVIDCFLYVQKLGKRWGMQCAQFSRLRRRNF